MFLSALPSYREMGDKLLSIDWVGVEDPWMGINVDLSALQGIVCEVFHVRSTQCGPPAAIVTCQEASYAQVYSFQLPTQTVVARVVAPVRPLFKTQGEIAAMDFIRSKRNHKNRSKYISNESTLAALPCLFQKFSHTVQKPIARSGLNGSSWIILLA